MLISFNSIIIIILIFGIHYVADFILQKNEDAKLKSTSFKHLLNHVFDYYTYFVLMMLGVWYAFSIHVSWETIVWFSLSVSFLHLITDYFTSKASKYYFTINHNKLFWGTIGVDQYLHQIQILLLTYYFIFS